MAGRANIPTNSSALIAVIADEVLRPLLLGRLALASQFLDPKTRDTDTDVG
jgi:hypothetical protein